MSRRVVLEVTVTTADEARLAADAGADRLELCAGLEVGGLTPSAGTFFQVRAVVAVPVYVLLRPRPGGFCYTDGEFAAVRHDAEWFRAQGADGIVGGALTATGDVDRARCGTLAEVAGGKVVFHRAFDLLADQPAALETLVALGFERVLTSGGAATAAAGADTLAGLVRQAAGRIGILPASGIRPENVRELLRATGCDQVHGSLRTPVADPTLAANPLVGGQMGGGTVTDANLVRRMRQVLDE